jgi:signal peptide peptidase SppA
MQWAMTEDGLRSMISIAERHAEVESLEKIRGQRPQNTEKATIRSGVGIIPIRGPLFKRANLMTDVCGATSYELVLRDFHQMLLSSDVQSIIFDIDSPGGEANGCSELADAIFNARNEKPIAAYVGGMGASAAYWIASACEKIFASDSAVVGSIGVQQVLNSSNNEGGIRFVASQSPNKNRDPGTEEGAKEVQAVIDGMAEVFIQKVARNRGVSRDHVLNKFGQGSVFIGAEAQNRGLIDQISTLESVISYYGEQSVKTESITAAFIAEKYPEVATHFIQIGLQKASSEAQEAVIRDRQRSARIRELCEGEVSSEFCQSLIEEGISEEAAAMRILGELKKSPRKPQTDKPSDPRVAYDRGLSSLNVPPAEESRMESLLRSSLEFAKKSGIQIREP